MTVLTPAQIDLYRRWGAAIRELHRDGGIPDRRARIDLLHGLVGVDADKDALIADYDQDPEETS